MSFLYILNSTTDKTKYFIGVTDDLEKRLHIHNNLKIGPRYTKAYRPWKIIYSESYNSLSEARKREFYLKSPKGYLEYIKIKNLKT